MTEDDDYLTSEESGEAAEEFRDPRTYGDALLDSHGGVRPLGTVNCNAVDARGNVSGVITTSGLAYKVPGRVGDSPIIGAGLYVNNDVGACGSTGRGEADIKVCGSHTVVELIRNGVSPTDACLEILRRTVRHTVARRLLDGDSRPDFNVKFYAVSKRGDYGAGAIRPGARYAVSMGGDARMEESAYLPERSGGGS